MSPHRESHFTRRIGWLRPVVLGANDGVVSTASLVLGVAAASVDRHAVLVAGVAGLVSGALSMAAGEYVSVSSQADTEGASLAKERKELASNPVAEFAELAGIYRQRGMDAALADQVARAMTDYNALEAHARDELGILEMTTARPVQAALASALSFAAGAVIPVIAVAMTPIALMRPATAAISLLLLAALGALGAKAGGAPVLKATVRVAFWGVIAMAVTYGLGLLVGGLG